MEKKPESAEEKRRRKFGEDIAYGLEQTVGDMVTDPVTDPVIGAWVQSKSHEGGTVHMGHTMAAEVIGDGAGFVFFVALRRFFPQVIDWLKQGAKACLDPLYDKLGRKSLASWARREHVDAASPEYQNKLDHWKDTQEENLAKSSVITGSSVVTNVLTQRALGNTHSLPIILLGKVIGASVTLLGMVGIRLVAPQAMHRLDKTVNQHLIAPVIHPMQKLFGAESAPSPAKTQDTSADALKKESAPFAERVHPPQEARQR